MARNGLPLINGVSYGWADIICLVAGVPVTGITAIDYDDKQDVVNNYGAGRYPVSRAKGRITCSAKITLSMDEVLAIQQRATNGRLQDVTPFDVQVSYLPENGAITHDVIRDCQFTTNSRKWTEGATSQPVELELIVSKIDWNA